MGAIIDGKKIVKYDGTSSSTAYAAGAKRSIFDYDMSYGGNLSYSVPDGIEQIAELAFSGAKQLSAVSLPESIQSIGNYAFLNCYSLRDIKMPQSVEYIGAGLFQNCWKLHSVALPEGLEILGNDMFESCHSLTTLRLPSSLKSVERTAFSGCRSLKEIYIDPSQLEVLPSSARYTAVITFMESQENTDSDISCISNNRISDNIRIVDDFVKGRQRALLDLAVNRRSTSAIRYMLDHKLVKYDALKTYLAKSAETNRVEITALLLEFGEQMKADCETFGDTTDAVLNEDPFA